MRKPLSPIDIARLTDAEIVARADELFCTCDAGQDQRTAHQRRYDAYLAFIAETEAVNAARRAALETAKLASLGVPKRFASATLEDLRLRVALREDDGQPLLDERGQIVVERAKQAGLNAAFALRDRGCIEVDRRKYSLLLYGASPGGTGKTTCVSAIFNHWRRQGRQGIWSTFAQLLLEIRAGYDDHTASARIKEVQDVDVLLLDELGEYNRAVITPNTMEILSWIIYQRHAWDRTTLFTTNLQPAQLARQLNPQLWNRIMEMAEIIEFAGEQLRTY